MSFASIEAFYQADERRRYSIELDFGVWWYDTTDRVPWRVSWVEATGDLYAVRLGPTRIHHTPEHLVILGGDEEGPVVLLAVVAGEAEIERRLEGWPHHCGQPGSLEWVRGQVR